MSPEEAAAAVEEIRERVRARHAKKVAELPDFELPPLEPLGRARDRAEAKSAAIGGVNPRPPGLLNNAIQAVKRAVARSLNWFVRDQVEFNRAAIAYMERNIEAMVEQNYALLRLAREHAALREESLPRLDELTALQSDVLKHWQQWRPAWEERLTKAEVGFLHAVREVEAEAREREAGLKSETLKLHRSYLDALSKAIEEVQGKFWADLAKMRSEQERLIHTELRLIRRRAAAPAASAPSAAPALAFDYARFEERFRGDEQYVAESLKFYLPYFEGAKGVVDLGCGRGEFLALLRAQGIEAVGVEIDRDALAACREKGLDAVEQDLFGFLAAQPDESLGGVLAAHVVEHLPPERTPELMEAVWRTLRPGGAFALETPNPGCLAIYAGDFYLDPTHNKPVPAAQLHFYMEEAGFGEIEVRERRPAVETFPELAALDGDDRLRGFRRKFFGGLDYAIVGRKLKS